MSRKLRPAIEIVSAIGALGFDLQHHDDAAIAEAVKMLRTVNPEMFDWLSNLLAQPCSCGDDPRPQDCMKTASGGRLNAGFACRRASSLLAQREQERDDYQARLADLRAEFDARSGGS